MVQSSKCQGVLGPHDRSCCKACFALVKWDKFRAYIAKKGYMLDLLKLVWKSFHATAAELHEFRAAMSNRDYTQTGLAGDDVMAILRIKDKMQLARKVKTKIECSPAWRFSASMKSVVSTWLVKPQHHHASETEALAYAGLSQELSQSIAAGRVRQLDVQLAAKVASGALRSEPIIESLRASFLMTFKENLHMYKRRTTSAFLAHLTPNLAGNF